MLGNLQWWSWGKALPVIARSELGIAGWNSIQLSSLMLKYFWFYIRSESPLPLPFSGSSVNCLLCTDRICCFQTLSTSSEVYQRGRQGAGPYQQMSSGAAWSYHDALSPMPLSGRALVLFIKRSKANVFSALCVKPVLAVTKNCFMRTGSCGAAGSFCVGMAWNQNFFFHRLMLYVKGKKKRCCCVLSPQMRWKVGFPKFMLGWPFNTKAYFKKLKQKWVPTSQLFKAQQSVGQAGIQQG